MVDYIRYNPKYRESLKLLIEELQDYIISIDSFDRVKRDPDFSVYILEKLERKIQKDTAQIFLAVELEQVLGMVVSVILDRDESYNMQVKEGKYGEIEKLFVLKDQRGKGIGNELFKLAEKYLKEEMGCDFIGIVVFGDNKKALEIYKNKDYREREYILLKKV